MSANHLPKRGIDAALLALLAMALTAYLLPWSVAPTAPMTLNAWDLAEWTSLHPAQRTATPGLLAPLLLRLQATLLAILCATALPGRDRLLAGIVIVLALAQLPPLEFINQLGDANYQQQALLAALTIGFTLIAARWLPRRWHGMAQICVAALGALTSVAGLSLALSLYALSLQAGEPGAGFGLMLLAYAALALLAAARWKRREADATAP